MHYYQFNIGDYKSHTEHLSEMEDLAYRRLLDWYYLHETPIPLDIQETARQISMRTHSECIATVLQEYFIRTGDGWTHGRADKEIAKTGEKSSKASESAKERWKREKEANAMRTHSEVSANAMRTECEGNATHNTRHITQDTKHKTQEIQAPEGVTIQTWQDFQKLRKTQKAPLTQSALDGIKSEATKAGWSLDDAMRECCARGWRGFKAKWVIDQQFNNRQIHAVQTVPSNAAEITKKMLAERDIGSPPPKEIREAISLLTRKK